MRCVESRTRKLVVYNPAALAKKWDNGKTGTQHTYEADVTLKRVTGTPG